MFDKLLELPFLMGITSGEVIRMLETVKFDFDTYEDGEIIVSCGDRCNRVVFVLDGTLIASCRCLLDKGFVEQTYDAKNTVLEPHHLWGMNQTYLSTYRSVGTVHTCSIDKQQFVQLIVISEVIRTNVLSTFCRTIQKYHVQSQQPTLDLKSAFCRFIFSVCQEKTGGLVVYAKMNDISNFLNVPRLNLSKILNEFEKQEILVLKRERIEISDLQRFFQSVM